MLVVERVDQSLRVGIVWIPLHLAHRHPPEPVLHNVVYRNVQRAIFGCHSFDLLLRLILVLALPEPVGPPPKQRNLARQFTIAADNLVRFRSVDEVVVNLIGNFCAPIECVHEAVIHPAARRIVPKDAVAVG